MMLSQDTLEDSVKDLILDICQVMRDHGYTEVSIGALMRLMGVEVDRAAPHDDESFLLDETFDYLIKTRDAAQCTQARIKNKTLH